MAHPARRARLSAKLAALGYEVLSAERWAELLSLAVSRDPRLAFFDHGYLAAAGKLGRARLRDALSGVSVVTVPEDSADPAIPIPSGPPAIVTDPAPAANPSISSARRLRAPRRAIRKPLALEPFVGPSPAIHHLADEARKALRSESPVLIEGETGTGKGVLAAWLHRHGPRARYAFVDLNCAGLSRELLESELFGHEKGAFTGAVSAKPGLLEVAEGGTLFLDEIGDMDPTIQAKLLKVIEERRYRRVGDTRERRADVRVLVATHHHLRARVRAGLFREDLYYRVSVLPLHVPALRERAADLLLLSRRILASLAADAGVAEPALTREAERALLHQDWPGNLRELRNVLERALLASHGEPLEPRHLELEVSRRPDPRESGDSPTLAALERTHIERVLAEEGLNATRAARRLGIPRSTFYQKLHALGIPTRRGRART